MGEITVDSLAERLIALGRAQQELMTGLGDALAEDGMSIDQWRVLARIDDLTLPTMGEIAEATGLANATLSRVVDSLEDRACVFRHQDAADRRRIAVSLTASGRERLSRAEAIVEAWSASVRSRLGAPALDAVLHASDVLRG